MTIKLAAISPKTIVSMGGNQGVSSPEELQLKELLQQMAYAMLQSKAPNLMPYITSFKPIEFDIDSNKAVGAFSLALNGVNIMIPIIMASGKVKSPEVFYSEKTDTYLPLNDQWIKEVQSQPIDSLGSPSKAPPGLSSDVDIRALTLPPTTGRFVYASYSDSKIDLPDLLSKADNNTKVAFSRFLKSNRRVLDSFVKYHGASSLKTLIPVYSKVASYSGDKGWFVLTPSSSKNEFQKALGKYAALGFNQACLKGYVTGDTRKVANLLVETELPLSASTMARSGITEPKSAGVYNLVKQDGSVIKCLIVPRVFNAGAPHDSKIVAYESKSEPYLWGRTEEAGKINRDHSREYLVITKDGKCGILNKVVALATTESIEDSGIVDEAFSSREARNGDKLFLGMRGSNITSAAYFPEGISKVSILSDDIFTAEYLGRKVTSSSSMAIKVPKFVESNLSGGGSFIIPSWYSPVSVSSDYLSDNDFISDPSQLLGFVSQKIASLSTNSIRIKKAGDGEMYINGISTGDIASTLTKLAYLGINPSTSSFALEKIQPNSSTSFNIVSPLNMPKLASIFGPDQMQQGMPPQGMPQDQMQQGMPPQGMPPQGMPQDQMQQGMPPQGMPGMAGEVPVQSEQAMVDASNLNDQDSFNAAMAGAVLNYNPLNEAIAGEIPKVQKALDGTARILVSVQMREDDLVSQLGQQGFSDLEGNLKKVLSSLGQVVLDLTKQRNMSALPEGLA